MVCLISPRISIFYISQSANRQVTLNVFLDTLLVEPGPQPLLWLPLMHKMAAVENGELILNQLT